jgi:hypothetical protein
MVNEGLSCALRSQFDEPQNDVAVALAGPGPFVSQLRCAQWAVPLVGFGLGAR